MRGIYGQFDSKIRFEIESDGRFDSRFDSNAKNDSQVPSKTVSDIAYIVHRAMLTALSSRSKAHTSTLVTVICSS